MSKRAFFWYLNLFAAIAIWGYAMMGQPYPHGIEATLMTFPWDRV